MTPSRLHCITSQWWQGDDVQLITLSQAINAGEAQVAGEWDWKGFVQPADRKLGGGWERTGKGMLKQNLLQ